jgi:solute carrier family 25 oxoglutarate transporter 11
MALNFAMFTTYEEAKERFSLMMPNNLNLAWFLASVCSGVAASTLSLPFDNAKTKLQSQKPQADGSLQYKNIFHALALTAKQSGVKGLWVGLPTYVFRISPHAMISLVAAE